LYGLGEIRRGSKRFDEIIAPTYTLLDYQARCMNYIFAHHNNPKQREYHEEGCVVDLPCGMGKTIVGIEFIRRLGRKAVVICHPSDISVSQWATLFHKYVPKLIVLEHHGTSIPPDADVIVTTINSVILTMGAKGVEYNQWLSKRGTIVYDEIHLLAASEFGMALRFMFARYQLGLSATVDRSDKKDRLITWGIGPAINSEKSLGIIPPKFNVLVRILSVKTERAAIEPKNPLNKTYLEMLKELTLSPDRANDLIKRMTERLGEESGECFIIFCNYIEECEFLLPIIGGHEWPGIGFLNTMAVYKSLDADAVKRAADSARVIVCTYKKAGTGFSPVDSRRASYGLRLER
jgi:superfamily II DNA or RNA helicase